MEQPKRPVGGAYGIFLTEKRAEFMKACAGKQASAVSKMAGDARIMADIDAVIRKCVDDIWQEYDKDNSGSLDKEETKKFVQNTLSEMNDSGEFSEDDFEACFKEFDKDGSGTIEPLSP